MTNAVIAGYVRSPFHFAGKGALARVRPDDLAAQVVRGADQPHRRQARGHRGHHRRLRLPRGRAGPQRRPPDRLAGRPAAVGGGRHGEPVLRLLHAVDPHRRRADRAGRRRGVHLRRHRKHEPRADGRLQSAAQSGAAEVDARRLYRHGRDGGERRPQMADPPRRAGGVRRAQPPAAPPPPPPPAHFADEIVPIDSQGRQRRRRMAASGRTPPPKAWPG